MHNGGKPYKCDQGKYSSKLAQALKGERDCHSEEKMFGEAQ